MSELTTQEFYSQIKDTLVMRIYDLAEATVASLAQSSFENGEDFITKDMMPLLCYASFKTEILEEELDPNESLVITVSNALVSGDYERITSNPLYKMYYTITNDHVDAQNYRNDKGQQVLAVLKDFTEEINGFMETLALNLDQDALDGIKTLFGLFTDKMENIAKFIETTK